MVDTLARIDYTARDAESIKAALVTFLKQKYPGKFNDFTESDLLVIILELFAYVGGSLSFMLDRMANEAYLETARERRNVVALAKLVGYKAASARAASVTLVVNLDDVADYDEVVVSKGERIEAASGVVFEIDKDYVLIQDGGGMWSVDGAPAVSQPLVAAGEGVTHVETFTSTGDVFQKFAVAQKSYIFGSSVVKVGGVEWKRVGALALGDPDDPSNLEIFDESVDADDLLSVRFGDDKASAAPTVGTEIEVSYRVGGGEAGNVEPSTIDATVQATGDASPIQVRVDNVGYAGSGGAERESSASIKFFAPLYALTNDRAITYQDYVVLASRFSDPEAGAVAKAGVVCAPSDGISNSVAVYYWTEDNDHALVEGGSVALTAALLAYLTARKVVTVVVSVLPGVNVPVDLTVRLRIDKRYDATAVVEAVDAALHGLFQDQRVRFENELRIAWIYEIVQAVPGVKWSHVDVPDPETLHATAVSIEADVLPSQAGMTSTQVKLPTGSSSVNDHYANYRVKVRDDETAETVKILSYVGATRVATVATEFVTQPVATDPYELFHPRLIKFPTAFVSDALVAAVTGESVPRDSGTTDNDPFVGTLAKAPIRPGTVTVTFNETSTATARTAADDGEGNLTGTGIAAGSTIDYATGEFSLGSTANNVDDSTLAAAYSPLRYVHNPITLDEGHGAGQVRALRDFDPVTRIGRVDANWTAYPSVGTKFSVHPDLRCAPFEALVAGTVVVEQLSTLDPSALSSSG